jgi:hypothetical protein
MGLQVSINFRGVQLTNAYFQVTDFSGDKGLLRFSVSTFAVRGDQPLQGDLYQCAYDLSSGKNALCQAYEFLKTLPEFAGATDVLESGQTA